MLDAVNACSFGSADQSNGRIQLTRERRNVYLATANGQIICHVQQNQSRQAKAEDGSREHEMTPEIRRIEDQNDRVGLGKSGPLALEHIMRDLFVFGPGMKAVDPG